MMTANGRIEIIIMSTRNCNAGTLSIRGRAESDCIRIGREGALLRARRDMTRYHGGRETLLDAPKRLNDDFLLVLALWDALISGYCRQW
jgi:hypothetical protein